MKPIKQIKNEISSMRTTNKNNKFSIEKNGNEIK